MGIQNYYSAFSREQEREADIFAAQTLNQLHISPEPLKKFLKILEKESFQKGLTEEDYKFSSHPVYKERFDILENESIDQKYKFDQKSSDRFFFIKAKLFGFTSKNNNEFYNHLDGDYYNFANSILLSRKGRLKESLKILNNIINKYPEYIFLIETVSIQFNLSKLFFISRVLNCIIFLFLDKLLWIISFTKSKF